MPTKEIILPKFYKEFKILKGEFNSFRIGTTSTLGNHTVALLNIESKLDLYRDMFYSNKEKIEELGSRVANFKVR